MESPDPVEIYLTVHAETAADAAMRLNGQLDTALTENGQAQAAELGKALGNLEFAAVYASDQFKDIHTARIIRGKQRGKSRSHGQSEHGSAWGGLRLF